MHSRKYLLTYYRRSQLSSGNNSWRGAWSNSVTRNLCLSQTVATLGRREGRTAPGDTIQGDDTLVKVKIIFAAEFTKNTAERIKWKCGEGASDDDD